MKRFLSLTLALSLLFSGCASSADGTVPLKGDGVTSAAKSSHVCDTSADLGKAPAHLLDNAKPWDGFDNLFEVPVDGFDQLFSPKLMYFGDDFLFADQPMDDDGNLFYTLRTLNHHTGVMRSSEAFPASTFYDPQVNGQNLCIADAELGTVRELDQKLNVVEDLSYEPGQGLWYVSPDGTSIYEFPWLGSPSSIRTSDMSRTPMMEGTQNMSNLGLFNDVVAFTCADPKTQLTGGYYLDLSDGSLHDLPMETVPMTVTRRGNEWLGSGGFDSAPYYYYDGSKGKIVTVPDSKNLYLIAPGKLLHSADSGHGLTLYDESGSMIDQILLPESIDEVNVPVLWSDLYEGCFFLVKPDSRKSEWHLMFWKVNSSPSGDPLGMTSYAEYLNAAPGTSVDASYYERAKEIGDRFHVEVLIADQCALEYPSFTVSQVLDEETISWSLDTLEHALSNYPDGYFDQLIFDKIRQIEISLVTDLVPSGQYGSGSYNGFAVANGDTYQVVVDVYAIDEATYYHEFSHVTDAKLEWDTTFRPDALYSEEHWKTLSPSTFDYQYSYTGEWISIYDAGLSDYFVDDYSCTYPTEDRARIIEFAMSPYPEWTFEGRQPLLDKLDYYSRCIRDGFDTTGWPEVTQWEQVLHQ